MWVHNVVLFLFTLTSPHSHSSRCSAYAVAGEEADEFSCKMVALCADVEVAEREGAVAVVEETMLKMAEVDVVVVGLSCR